MVRSLYLDQSKTNYNNFAIGNNSNRLLIKNYFKNLDKFNLL